jgi:hypothetical protein
MDNTTKPTLTFTIFMLVKTTAIWLRLTSQSRFAFLDKTIKPILAAHQTVKMRFYDSEAFSAKASDIIVWETTDLYAYQHLVEALRETDFWGTYFEVLDIIPSIQNAYATMYEVEPY